jgi:hypothetical protein
MCPSDRGNAIVLGIHEELAQEGLALELPAVPAERTLDALLAIIAKEAKR